jgi:tetratricopeptide (TPR) repeat protein
MRYIKLYFLAALFLGLGSCKKFLEKPPEGKLEESTALVDEASLQALLNGTFNTQANEIYNGRIWFINDLMSDQVNGLLYTEDNGEIYNRKTSIFGAFKNDAYTRLYQNIYRANKVLERIDLASANRNKIEGEARFIRAIMHFEAVRMWAQPWGFTADNSHPGVVIRTTPDIELQERSTVKQVYDFIISDLQSAENLLPDAVVLGYPSRWAAKALLAKVYFQQNNFASAFNYADQVIKSNKFSLDNSVNTRFSLATSNEIIYGFRNIQGVLEPGGELRDRYRSDVGFNAGSDFKVTDQFRNLATQPGDARAAWYTSANGYNAITKYNANQFNVAVIHLTEIKLIRAESAAETGAVNLAIGITDINDILRRAYGGNTMNLPTTASAADVIRVSRIQREFEMVGEGNRLNEIKRLTARTGATPDRRNAPIFCPGMVLQFPQGEKAGNTNFVMNAEGGCN